MTDKQILETLAFITMRIENAADLYAKGVNCLAKGELITVKELIKGLLDEDK